MDGSERTTSPLVSQLPFHEAIHLGYAYAEHGQFQNAQKILEPLVAQHPKDYIVHDVYVRVLLMKGDLDRAVKILEQAEHQMPERSSEIKARMEQIQKRKAFAEAMKSAVSWEKRKSYSNAQLSLETNIPYDYLQGILTELQTMLDQDRTSLSRILKQEPVETQAIKIWLFGSYQEYETFLKTRIPKDRGYTAGAFDRKHPT